MTCHQLPALGAGSCPGMRTVCRHHAWCSIEEGQHLELQERGHSRPVGVEHAGLWGIISFSWIGPLLRLGARGGIQENSASPFIPEADDAAVLARQFERKYAALQVHPSGLLRLPSVHDGPACAPPRTLAQRFTDGRAAVPWVRAQGCHACGSDGALRVHLRCRRSMPRGEAASRPTCCSARWWRCTCQSCGGTGSGLALRSASGESSPSSSVLPLQLRYTLPQHMVVAPSTGFRVFAAGVIHRAPAKTAKSHQCLFTCAGWWARCCYGGCCGGCGRPTRAQWAALAAAGCGRCSSG